MMKVSTTEHPTRPRRRLFEESVLANRAAGARAWASLRSADRRAASASAGMSTPPSLFVLAANRMSYGPSPGDRASFDALGSSDVERFDNYVEQQLDPDSIPDPTYEARRAAAQLGTLDLTLNQLWLNHHANNNQGYSYRVLPAYETERDVFLRAICSRRQLHEVVSNFWINHFNIYGWDYWSLPVWPHWVRQLRSHSLGNFRNMLHMVARHAAMLFYLDNYTNSKSGPNENWARELFELHTMGAENYLGVVPWHQVPQDAAGRPIGYVDNDVFEATRCFTGWSVAHGYDERPDDGSFFYSDEDHDRFQKIVLRTFIDPDQAPEHDGNVVLNALAEHPGTARHIARKLCRRFVADDPPESLVTAAADTFHQNVNSSRQIERTLRVILKSDELKNTWGEKVKRPFEVVVGALRATGLVLDFHDDADDLDSFLWRFEQTGHGLFGWHPPDGYPDTREKWESTTPRVMTWRLMLWLSNIHDPSDRPRLQVASQMGTNQASALELADFWIDRILRRPMISEDRDEVIALMAQGFNPHLQLDLNDEDVDERARMMIALILNSPDNLEK